MGRVILSFPSAYVWFVMYILVETSELTPFNVNGIFTENRYVWVLIGIVVRLFVE
jgi:hypothetical protein